MTHSKAEFFAQAHRTLSSLDLKLKISRNSTLAKKDFFPQLEAAATLFSLSYTCSYNFGPPP